MDANIKPPASIGPVARPAAAAEATGTVAARAAQAPAPGNLAADDPAPASLLDALKQSQDRLKTVMTGVDNQAPVQTLLQVQGAVQEVRILPELLAALNKQAAEERHAAISKV